MEKTAISDITVTHINIRESISILVFKLISLDFIAALLTILFFAITSFNPNTSISERILTYNTMFFVLLGFFKISFTIYVILLWLNEYYELSPTSVVHNKGFLWKDEERYQLEYVRTIKAHQGLLGRLLNFGTVELYDIRGVKRVQMYLIHNPHRYVRILEKLVEHPHEEKHEFRKHIFEKNQEDDEEADE